LQRTSDGTKLRMKPGDRICFYVVGKGVVAHAKITGSAKWEPHPKARRPDQYPWTVALDSPRMYLEKPVRIDDVKRGELDAFRGIRTRRSWAWFVQATRQVSEDDFRRLTRQG